MTHTAPYTSPLCGIEWKWQDSKGWAANPCNQYYGRSCAQVVQLMQDKLYTDVLNAAGDLQPLVLASGSTIAQRDG